MPALRTAILVAGLCILPALAAEPPPGVCAVEPCRLPPGGAGSLAGLVRGAAPQSAAAEPQAAISGLGLRSPALSRQRADGEGRGGLQQIRPGHYVYLHTDDTPGVSSTFNSGIIVTSEGVVVVDALGSEAIAREVREAIATVTDQPVR